MKIQLALITLALVSPAAAQHKPIAPARVDACAPIGRTADGQLVYSMKCENLPASVAPARAQATPPPPTAPVVEEEKGLFRNPFSNLGRPSSSDEREAGVGPPPSGR